MVYELPSKDIEGRENVLRDAWYDILDFIIPMFNDKALAILNDPERKELAERLSIIDGESPLLSIFEKNKNIFRGNKVAFIKFILKLDLQELLFYRKNIKWSIGYGFNYGRRAAN